MSLFSSKKKLIIGNAQIVTSKKSKISIVQQLIDALDLKGVIFTLDALHCPKKTTAVIVNSNNEYLIGVKGNQPKLYKRVTEIFSDRDNWSSSYGTIEVNKGRTESRYKMEGISKKWNGLQQIVAVNRRVKDKGKISEETAYFISSKDSNAFFYAEGTRNHWSIENSLHLVKDVTLKEDSSKITKGNAPQNMSTIKNIGINLLRKNNFTSIAQGIRLVANDIKKLFKMIK